MTDSPKPGAAEDEFVPSGDTVSDAIIVKLARANTEAQARIAELEAQLTRAHTAKGIAEDQGLSVAAELDEAQARIRELEAALAETVQDGAEGAEIAIRRAEAAESDLKLLHQELDRLQRATGPQTCDVHASFSAGCLNCRLAQRDAQLAAAEERERRLSAALGLEREEGRDIISAALDWADAATACDAGAGGSGGIMRACEGLLMAAIRDYRKKREGNTE